METTVWRSMKQTVTNAAYAWRQMVFLLSLVDDGERQAFVAWAAEHFGKQTSTFRERFGPAVRGLEHAAARGSFDADGHHGASDGRRFLGWTTGRHWAFGPETARRS